MQKRVAKTLIKPVEFRDFLSPETEMDPGIIKKALPREGSRNTIAKHRNTL